MSAEENKAVARHILEEFSKGNVIATVDEYFAADYVDHAIAPDAPPGREGLKLFFESFRAAFPDLRYVIDDELAEGDKVVQRVAGRGTMEGEFQGMPATGKHAMWSEIHITRFAGSKVVEHWANVDELGMLQQLGLAPAPGQPGG